MIEITFDGSTSGMLYYNASVLHTPGIIRKEIIELNLMMDFGYLDSGLESDERLEYADHINLIGYPDFVSEDTPEDILEAAKVPDDFVPGNENRQYMKKLKRLLAKGKEVRIWYDDEPGSQCGFYAFCAFLRDYENKVYVIKAPRCIKGKEGWWLAPGWGTFNMESLEPLLPLTRELSRGEMEAYAKHWDQLIKENAPLRAMIGGVPVSVPEDFYDRFLYEFIPEGPFKISRLQWEITKKYPIGLYTAWYDKRLWEKLQQGEFEIVSKDLYFTDMYIQKC